MNANDAVVNDSACTTGSASPDASSLIPFKPKDGNAVDRKDTLGLHVMRLLTLHRDAIKFRLEISKMDVVTKQTLVADIYSALGIQAPQ